MDKEKNLAIATSRHKDLALSQPGKLLTRMTADLLPVAHEVRKRDDLLANPRYAKGYILYKSGEFSEAATEFRLAAELGHRTAQYQLAEMYLAGKGVEKNYKNSFYWFHRAADQGDANAQNRLGWMCESGLGTERSQTRAVNWFRMAAERGHLEAQFNLGAKYDNGEGVLLNHAEAARWYLLSAEQGFADARFFLAQMLETGEGVPKNFEEALDWYILAVEQGHRSAEIKLWSHALAEKYLPEDDEEKIFIEKLGSKMGHALAQFKLGYRYDVGEGIEKNHRFAIELYKKSAEQGFYYAISHLSLSYKYGRGVNQNLNESTKWKARMGKPPTARLAPQWMFYETISADPEKIAELRELRIIADSGQVQVMSNLAEKYYFGKGTSVDYAKAIYWSKKGADANITYCHYLYGHMLYYGTAKQIDKNLGLMHLRIAAETGHHHAMLLTARILINTSGNKEGIEEGVAFLIKLASQGSADAQFDLGYQYSLGKNVQIDHKKSLRWYKKASEQGHVGALYNLASMYHYGNAIKQDIDKAIELYESAAQRGMELACGALKDLYSHGTLVPQDLLLAAYWEKEASRIKREAEAKKPASLENISQKLSTGVSTSRRQRLAEKRSLSRKGSDMLEHIDTGEN